jgi:hypothetical protein
VAALQARLGRVLDRPGLVLILGREGIETLGDLASTPRYEVADLKAVGDGKMKALDALLARHGLVWKVR